MQSLLDGVIARNRQWTRKGKVADYIPALGNADRDLLGICITDLTGQEWSAGDAETPFTMQSIAKIVTLLCAIEDAPMRRIAKTNRWFCRLTKFANRKLSREHYNVRTK